MGYAYQGFKEGMTLTHTHLINMEEAIISNSQGGLEDLYASSYGVLPGEVAPSKMTALLNAASIGNKTIRFNDGIYIFAEQIKVPSNVSLVGSTKTVFKPKSASSPTILMRIDQADNVFVSHITLDGGLTSKPTAASEGTQYGMAVMASRSVNIENVDFVGWNNCGLYSLQMSSFGTEGSGDGKWFKQLQITNCRFYFNYRGSYLYYGSEYNQLLNCVFGENYIGSINCGGNNSYVSCQWNVNTIGFKLENSGGNPAHGGCVGCTFNHNYETAIQVDDCVNGWTFTGCQIFYANVNVINSKGVIFTGNVWGQCTYYSSGNPNSNLITNTFFASNSSTILANNDGSTLVYCCLPNYLPSNITT